MIVSIYIHNDFDIDEAVEWATNNCVSFESYKLIELGWEEKIERECWFRVDVAFRDERDVVMFSLRWL